MAATLGSLDVLVFTAGVGENAASLRASVCGRLEFLGVRLDHERNITSQPDSDIASRDSPVRILVIHSGEPVILYRIALTGKTGRFEKS